MIEDTDTPDFLGVGAQKCATTWLHVQLSRHPELWLPRWKELHFFDQKMHLKWPLAAYMLKKEAHRWRTRLAKDVAADLNHGDWTLLRWHLRQHLGRPGLDWYRRNFVPGRGKIRGEITPAYATLADDQVDGVRKLLPDAKIIFLMRSPIERDWSASLMLLQRDSRTSTQATAADVRSLMMRSRVEARSEMGAGFHRWATRYPPDRVYLGFLEDIAFQPDRTVQSVYEFVGATRLEVPPEAKTKVHSRSEKSIPLAAARFLAERNLAQIELLAARFGGYALLWLDVAKWLIDQPGDGQVPYPFFNLAVWQERARKRGIRPGIWFQSGTLSNAN